MHLDQFDINSLKDVKTQSQKEIKAKVQRITMLQKEYQKSQVQFSNTLKQTSKIEFQKVQFLNHQAKYSEMLETQNANLNQKRYDITINNFNNQQRLNDSLDQDFFRKKDAYENIKQLLTTNHEKLYELHSISELSKKIKHDNVVYAENQSKQNINDYWMKKMQLQKYFQDQNKIEYINQARQNRLKMKSLEKIENQQLKQLEITQARQNNAANRLEKLYLLPKEQYFNEFEKLEKLKKASKLTQLEENWNQFWKIEKKQIKKNENIQQEVQKFEPYRQPLPLLNGSKFISVNSSMAKLINFPDSSLGSGLASGKYLRTGKSSKEQIQEKQKKNQVEVGRMQFQSLNKEKKKNTTEEENYSEEQNEEDNTKINSPREDEQKDNEVIRNGEDKKDQEIAQNEKEVAQIFTKYDQERIKEVENEVEKEVDYEEEKEVDKEVEEYQNEEDQP